MAADLVHTSNPKEQKLVIIEALFIEEISGMAIVKLLDMQEQVTVILKLKFKRNKATVKALNNTKKVETFEPTEKIGHFRFVTFRL